MELHFFDSELKVMEVLWEQGALPAGKIAKILKDSIGWNRNTTYTVIKKCIEKNAVERTEPHFVCRAIVDRRQAQHAEMDELIDKMFDGSKQQFFAAFLNEKELSDDEIQGLKNLIKQLK